ncbi:hypothetical protein B0H14DRAFT_2570426 [Mycena olivaceomarginata]|nr:hypothetical protein B0H14DRAFT_2570426 [Mycena olivaceomarginata]
MYSKFGRDSVCSYATEQIIFSTAVARQERDRELGYSGLGEVQERCYHTTGAFTFQESAVYIYGIDWLDDSNVTFAMQNPPLMGFHYWMGAYDGLFFSAAVQHIVTWRRPPSLTQVKVKNRCHRRRTGTPRGGTYFLAPQTIDRCNEIHHGAVPATSNCKRTIHPRVRALRVAVFPPVGELTLTRPMSATHPATTASVPSVLGSSLNSKRPAAWTGD